MRTLRSILPPLNFITIHYAYFVVVPLVSSLIFWGSSDPKFSITYVDSLFLVTSAMTEAGLNTVNLSQMTTWQQILLWLLIIIGSSIWVSIWTVLVRKHAFEVRFEEIVRKERKRRLERRNASLTLLPITHRLRTLGRSSRTVPESGGASSLWNQRPAIGHPAISQPSDGRLLSPVVPLQQETGARDLATPESQSLPHTDGSVLHRRSLLPVENSTDPQGDNMAAPGNTEHVAFVDNLGARARSSSISPSGTTAHRHFSTTDTVVNRHSYLRGHKVGRNGQFHDLTSEEREELGGTEYRALKLLSVVVPVYFVSWQFFGCISLGAWIANNLPQPAEDNGISPWWNGIFNGVSAFNNSGMSVLDLNMIPYGSSYFVLIVMGAMILAGNTAYPVFLRLILWCSLKALKLVTYPEDLVDWKETLEYILKYPRRVYTNLFPSRQTYWLVFMLFVLNGTDWVAFEVLNLGNSTLEQTPLGSRIIDGLFQAIAVRSGGFYVISIPTLFIGLQVLYVIMMYISVYPVVITMRHSNVYEERSLGIYGDDPNYSNALARPISHGQPGSKAQSLSRVIRLAFAEWYGVGAAPDQREESRISFISHQIRGQLSHDLWWLVLAVLLIVIIETKHFIEDPVTFSVFNVVFEVVSAYGCVGISIGLPTAAYSFSGGLYPGSKLILCAVMIRGRHRGLPVALDRAVRLPSDDMHRVEEEDHQIRRSMSTRRPSVDDMSII
ncbi:TrkH-domain-containing protein [Annulohypoxylon maeteangense]|uniref:TrkH-domain-containing protein n=1 Tax=Annulohypoxylon maeteangense TaxID=1927788 RepID=UPI002008026C|nr:TrkH-domain-containing protein [Annulohypoxylon maeteangense]KAI0879795.1 TrkH-domain-containing protein [Annulohypoxylon maeteangense]